MVNLAWCNFPHSPIIDIICQNYALKRSKYQMFPTMVKHKEVYSIVQLYRCVFIKSLVAITSGRVREWGGRLCMRQNVTWIKLVIFNPKRLKNRLWPPPPPDLSSWPHVPLGPAPRHDISIVFWKRPLVAEITCCVLNSNQSSLVFFVLIKHFHNFLKMFHNKSIVGFAGGGWVALWVMSCSDKDEESIE